MELLFRQPVTHMHLLPVTESFPESCVFLLCVLLGRGPSAPLPLLSILLSHWNNRGMWPLPSSLVQLTHKHIAVLHLLCLIHWWTHRLDAGVLAYFNYTAFPPSLYSSCPFQDIFLSLFFLATQIYTLKVYFLHSLKSFTRPSPTPYTLVKPAFPSSPMLQSCCCADSEGPEVIIWAKLKPYFYPYQQKKEAQEWQRLW